MKNGKWDIDCVIYDCDGVLFDSLEQNRKLYNHIAVSVGRAPITDEEAHYCHTHTVYESIHHVFRDDEAGERKALAFWKNELDFSNFIAYLTMEPNLMEVLRILKKRGMKLAISTNRTTTMPTIMKEFALSEFFDMVVTAMDVENPKPHRESVDKIVGVLGVERKRVLYVGDSDVDRKTALASGVKFIAYKNAELESDAAINDHRDLLDLLSDGLT